MKTKTINLYKYEELNEKAKEKALNDFRNNEDNDFSFLEEDLKEFLKSLLEENKIIYNDSLKSYYSLSYSQGDGFCFIGDFKFKGYNIKITHNFRYYHNRSTDIILYDEKGNEDFQGYEDLENEFKNIYYSICQKCEKIGYNIMEEENSEEYIKDYFNSNDITFRENGEIENE
jgi:hypothetical protein